MFAGGLWWGKEQRWQAGVLQGSRVSCAVAALCDPMGKGTLVSTGPWWLQC